MSRSIITLTTDFGTDSPYVAQMKGVILSLQAEATIVDITHAIPPQQIAPGALALRAATPHFPPGSIHVAVVDPGVGTARKIVYAEIGGRHYIAPDNGLLSLLAEREGVGQLRSVTNRALWRPEVSATFHGRDIMAPVAAHLSRGLDPAQVGEELDDLQPLDWPRPAIGDKEIAGQVAAVDAFGNLITNIEAAELATLSREPAALEVELANRRIVGLVSTYGEQANGALVALIGSSGALEVAVVGGSAATRLGGSVGMPVTVRQVR